MKKWLGMALWALAMFPMATLQAAGVSGESWVISGYNEPEGDRAGVEVSYLKVGRSYLGFKASGVLYVGKNDQKFDDLFGGYSASGFFHFNQPLNPYVGAGLFMGRTFNCSSQQQQSDACLEDYVVAVYPEAGLMLQLDDFLIAPFVRRYFDTNSNADPVNAFGVSLGYRFR